MLVTYNNIHDAVASAQGDNPFKKTRTKVDPKTGERKVVEIPSSSETFPSVGFSEFTKMITKNPGDAFGREIARVIELASDIAEELPTKNAKTRKRAWGRRGGRVSVPSLLSGNVSRAFAKHETKWTTKPPRHVAIIVPGSFAWHVSPESIAWCTAGPLALALYLETEFGIAVDLWNYTHVCQPWDNGPQRDENYTCVVRVKPPHAGVTLEDVVPTMHESWFRGLHFRLMENQGVPAEGYGTVKQLGAVSKQALEWADKQGIHGHVLLGVAGYEGLLRDRTTVMTWIEAQFRVLQLID